MRSTPFDLVFGSLAAERFPPIRDALARGGQDPRDRDAFLMIPEVVQLVRDLRPEEGVGEAIDQLVAFLHHAYLFWEAGGHTIALDAEATAELLGPEAPAPAPPALAPPALYAQLPPRAVWARLYPEDPPEPMDGCFVDLAPPTGTIDGALRVLGIFGMHPARAGFSVVEAAGVPGPLAREDGSHIFAATLAGGESAGLFELIGAEELVELGRRARGLAGADGNGPA